MDAKFKTFVVGVLLGSMLTGGIGYAADKLNIAVTFPKIAYWNDKGELSGGAQSSTYYHGKTSVPLTIMYDNTAYAPVRFMSDALGGSLEWDDTNQRIVFHSLKQLDFTTVKVQDAPQQVRDWVERSKYTEMTQSMTVDGITYILVTYGMQKTGGYEVNILNIKQEKDDVRIMVKLTNPVMGMPVSQAITFPYALVKLDQKSDGPFVYQDVNGKRVDLLKGIRSISPILKKTSNIMLFPISVQDDKIAVSGVVRAFGGIVHLTLQAKDGSVVLNQPIQAAADAPDWGYFTNSFPKSLIKPGMVLSLHISGQETDKSQDNTLKFALDTFLNN